MELASPSSFRQLQGGVTEEVMSSWQHSGIAGMPLGVGLQRTDSCRKHKVEGQVLGIRQDLVVVGTGEVRDPGRLLSV